MVKNLIKGAVVGAVIVFAWGCVSWMFIPWHKNVMKGFANEAEVQAVIKSNASESGVYMIPNCCPSEQDTAMQMQQMAQGAPEPAPTAPVVNDSVMFISVALNHPAGMGTMNFVYGFLAQLVAAGLITYLLMHVKGKSYFCRVLFVAVVGFTIGWVSMVPAWNWLGFPTDYVWVSIADLTIGWFLAGLGMAAVCCCKPCGGCGCGCKACGSDKGSCSDKGDKPCCGG